ncbi:MAG: hypothetical protein AB1921_00935 [Thermodesulfobacteriota bacterium]
MGLIRKLAELAVPLAISVAQDPRGEMERLRAEAKKKLSQAELLALLALRAALNARINTLSRGGGKEEGEAPPKFENLEIE